MLNQYELCSLSVLVLTIAWAARHFRRYRDPLAPVIVFAPMLIYIYSYLPLAISYNEGWLSFPGLADALPKVGLVNLLGVTAFLYGLTYDQVRGAIDMQAFRVTDSAKQRQFLLRVSVLMGFAAAGAFFYMVERGGGFWNVFSRGKTFISGGGVGTLASCRCSVFRPLSCWLWGFEERSLDWVPYFS